MAGPVTLDRVGSSSGDIAWEGDWPNLDLSGVTANMDVINFGCDTAFGLGSLDGTTDVYKRISIVQIIPVSARLPVASSPATVKCEIRRPYAAQLALLGCELFGRMRPQPPIRPISLGLTSREAQSWQGRLGPGRFGDFVTAVLPCLFSKFPLKLWGLPPQTGLCTAEQQGNRGQLFGIQGLVC